MSEPTKIGVIHWESMETGFKSHGQPIDYSDACAHAKLANALFTGFRHWVVEVHDENN